MANVTIIKGKDLFMNRLANILSEELPEHHFTDISLQELIYYKKKLYPEPDLLIVEIRPDINFNKLLTYYSKKNIKIAVWAPIRISRKELMEYIKLDINGYFLGEIELKQLKYAIGIMLHGDKYIHSTISSMILEEFLKITGKKNMRPTGLLTKREWEVLEEMAKGYQNEEIANHLIISKKTVNNHVVSILRKLRVKDRTNAVITAIRNNWVNI